MWSEKVELSDADKRIAAARRSLLAHRKQTPWGEADLAIEFAPGIVMYHTPSHGGFQLSVERMAELLMIPGLGHLRPFAGPGWFEEDVDWAIVVLAWPRHFTDDEVATALGMACDWWGRGGMSHPGFDWDSFIEAHPQTLARVEAWKARKAGS